MILNNRNKDLLFTLFGRLKKTNLNDICYSSCLNKAAVL